MADVRSVSYWLSVGCTPSNPYSGLFHGLWQLLMVPDVLEAMRSPLVVAMTLGLGPLLQVGV